MTTAKDQPLAHRAEILAISNRMRPQFETAQTLVLEVLREAILRGVLEPGARLRQEDLAAAFQTSRIPVRDALRALEHEGLARSEPHRGFTVTTLDSDQIEEIYDLRILLEGHAIRLAVPLLTAADLDELQRLYDDMETTADADEKLAKRELLYITLYSVTARPRLVGLIVRLRQEVARSLRWKLVEHSPKHHEVIFTAIRNGQADIAAEELATHLRQVVALLRRFLREAKDGSRPA